MRQRKDGYLTDEWKDVYEEDRVEEQKNIISKDKFEKYYGKFIAAMYINKDDEIPYCIWTEDYVITFTKTLWYTLIKSMPRNPKVIQFS